MEDDFLELIANEDISKLFYRIFFSPSIELEFVLYRKEEFIDVIIYRAHSNERTKELAICCNQSNVKQVK